MFWLIRNYRGEAIYCMKEDFSWDYLNKPYQDKKRFQILTKKDPGLIHELYVVNDTGITERPVKWSLIYSLIKIAEPEYETYLEMDLLGEIPYAVLLGSIESIIEDDTVLSATYNIPSWITNKLKY